MIASRPLASLMRPKSLDDYVGQQHLVGKSGPIRQLCENTQLCSMILWGPPGCGKTSLVSVFEHYWSLPIIHMSAINSGVKDIKALSLNLSKNTTPSLIDNRSIVFVDEIHRFNKAQQDAFLPLVESGDIVLIGASTENPAFSINSALLSRMRVFTLKGLQEEDLQYLFERCLRLLGDHDKNPILVSESLRKLFIKSSNGDARKLIGTIEVAHALRSAENNPELTEDHFRQAHGQSVANFDKQGDYYYDTLSAFHKSVRGSDVDASLFWFAKLLLSSSDVVPICRRLLAIASEDIGLADPKALQVCLNAWDVYHRVGQAEGERCVAQAIIYCALAPKSNRVYMAFTQAKEMAKKYANEEVPMHLRNATSSIVKELGHGKDYQYAHNFDHAFASKQEYLPENVIERNYYQASDRGFEKQLAQKIAFLDELRKHN